MLCRFCNIRPCTVDAHIIPKSFFVEYADAKYPSREVTDLENVFPKKRPVGDDDYGYRFFHPLVEYSLQTNGQGAYAYVIKDVDYDKLKLFLLAVLWRASVSTQDFYAGVNLGTDEEKIRHLLERSDPGTPDEYPVYFQRFNHPSSLVPIPAPSKVSVHDIEMYELVLNGFIVSIKVDAKPLPEELRAIMLHPEKSLFVPQVEWKGSPEREIALKVLRDAYKRT